MNTATITRRQEWINRVASGDLDYLIRDLDERTTKDATKDVSHGLALIVEPLVLGWLARVVNAEDFETEYDAKRYDTLSEATEWGASALLRLAEDCNDAIQEALQERMKELRGIASTDRNAPHPFR